MDYGTVCHAIALSAVARTAQGGITGFQAGAVMWEFIKIGHILAIRQECD